MRHKKSVGRKKRNGTGKNAKERAKTKPLSSGRTNSRRAWVKESTQKNRAFDALNLYRHGKAKSPSAAARQAGTTLKKLWQLTPSALTKDRRTGRLRIKATDPYSAKVQILTEGGAITATARGSRQREVAGRHRATVVRVLAGDEPVIALAEYRGKKVGGHELISDYSRLTTLAQAGVLGQLENLYVSPEMSA